MSEFDTLRSQLSKLEKKAAFAAKTAIENPRWTSSRLWIVLGSIIGLILLHRYGLDFGNLVDHMVFLVVVLLITRTLTDINCAICRVLHDYVRYKYGGKNEEHGIVPQRDDPSQTHA
jgi:hypothetical protein